MGYKNPKELLADAIKFPVAIEGMLPAGAPKLSERLVETTGKLPDLPNFVVEIPALPEVPAMPAALGRKTLRVVGASRVVPVSPTGIPAEQETVRIITP